MASYLLTWNRERYNWDTFHEDMQEVNEKGFHITGWSCGNTKKIVRGDRVFLMKLGSEQKGIVASGEVASKYYEDVWFDEKERFNRTVLFVKVKFDAILDPDGVILTLEALRVGISNKVRWTPQASGMTIPDDVAIKLEKDWALLLSAKRA